jgi:hypothetical protein
LGGRYDVRVLEPSPPPDETPPWFADDPVHRPGPVAGETVAPVPGFAHTWDDLSRDDPGLAVCCAPRWLGGWRRLGPAPDDLVEQRRSLHHVAEELSRARAAVNGKIGLRWVRGGFGTPYFGDGQQLRADAGFLGEWFGFCTSVLEEARMRWSAFDTRVQLWPEHFDMSIDTGDRVRATYGGSPGDDEHAEPYLYVGPWERQTGDFWSDPHFGGASLAYAELLAAGDQRAAALAFFEAGRALL